MVKMFVPSFATSVCTSNAKEAATDVSLCTVSAAADSPAGELRARCAGRRQGDRGAVGEERAAGRGGAIDAGRRRDHAALALDDHRQATGAGRPGEGGGDRDVAVDRNLAG